MELNPPSLANSRSDNQEIGAFDEIQSFITVLARPYYHERHTVSILIALSNKQPSAIPLFDHTYLLDIVKQYF
jgi:hypothetical protein